MVDERYREGCQQQDNDTVLDRGGLHHRGQPLRRLKVIAGLYFHLNQQLKHRRVVDHPTSLQAELTEPLEFHLQTSSHQVTYHRGT